jgi:CBS domain-containing protein
MSQEPTKEVVMREANRIPTARDLMNASPLTFRPHQTILEAMESLLKHGASGAPVVDDEGVLLGMISELDCLRMLASDEFFFEDLEDGTRVADCMNRDCRSIPSDLGIYAITHYFLTGPIRRLPVVDQGRLIGQVSRRDVLRWMEGMHRRRVGGNRYPDYLRPAESSGARRARL